MSGQRAALVLSTIPTSTPITMPPPHRSASVYYDDDDTALLFVASTEARVPTNQHIGTTRPGSIPADSPFEFSTSVADLPSAADVLHHWRTTRQHTTAKRAAPSPPRRGEPRGRGDAGARLGRYPRGAAPASPSSSRGKPRWYACAFGTVRLPVEMDLEGIRRRQGRRRGSPEAGGGGGGWRWLRSLSCKSDVDVAVVECVGEEGLW